MRVKSLEIQFINIAVPSVEMVDDHGRVIEEKIYKTGSTIELKCVVSKVPGPTANVMWRHGFRTLNYDTSRGGIRWLFPTFSLFAYRGHWRQRLLRIVSLVSSNLFTFFHLAFPTSSIRPVVTQNEREATMIFHFFLCAQRQNWPVAIRRRQSPLHRQRQSERCRQLYLLHYGIFVDDSHGPHPQW